MDKRPLGNSGFAVAPLALGGNVFGWTADERTSFQVLDAFVAGGFALIDTANSYSRWVAGHQGGESETVIGNWIARRGRHDDVVIATKVGSDMGLGHKCLKRTHIVEQAEASLRRLRVERIDLYQSHWDDATTPLDETLEAYDRLIRQGKVKAIGASNLTAERLAEALAVSRSKGLPRYATMQPHYNLLVRDEFEGPLQRLCVQEGIGVIPYYSLAAGFLTGKYRSEADVAKSVRGPGLKKYLNQRGAAVLAALERVAARRRATMAQVALAWLMGQPGIVAPIASATSVAQLEELMGAARLELAAEDVDELALRSDSGQRT
ncbi:MAG TPA: aldo/keto reductase [Casimicrobiaceae bacterium]|jgi:aryl-alcohol dehydrogenase-like predicted oxidoreductase|nr:aldo/keto reductase [Casimicrobiaceae bacterium]